MMPPGVDTRSPHTTGIPDTEFAAATEPVGTVISVRNLTTSFRVEGKWNTVVNGISFDVAPRETVAIVGESGSGKSVTALSIMRLLPAANSRATGEILFDGHDLLALPEEQMRKIRGDAGIAGVLMPNGCPGSPAQGAQCLTPDEIEAIETWILACAPNN